VRDMGFHINPVIYAWGSSEPSGGSAAAGTSVASEKDFTAASVMATNTAGAGINSVRGVSARASGDLAGNFAKARIRRGKNMAKRNSPRSESALQWTAT
jgi:hypothetical protein